MSSYNKIIFMGNMTRDPQLSFLPSQTPVVEFGLAANRKWKSKDGQDKEEVTFVDCVAFGTTAETIDKFFSKGKPILVEGRLQFDQWEAQDGSKRSKHKINVREFSFVGTKDEGGGQQRNPAPGEDTVANDELQGNADDFF